MSDNYKEQIVFRYVVQGLVSYLKETCSFPDDSETYYDLLMDITWSIIGGFNDGAFRQF